ncbi:hypothetical protein N7495_010065 [Penicillium taxi]|uniref:uncharacterized protein n=1 Tax=Penicillium taxi TaxID=168475 RepID=UPI0025450D4F|nr:uncharacterized protein N7495_010065 [Penicillium taxi]KAJ5885555.1 hypothetical protein N7495_010065 [Penicillium taxi]
MLRVLIDTKIRYLPIVDIFCQAKDANQLPSSVILYDREQWTSDVELCTPGYLALEAEAAGRVPHNPSHYTRPYPGG